MQEIGLLSYVDNDSIIHYQGGVDYFFKRSGREKCPSYISQAGNYDAMAKLREEGRWDDITENLVQGAKILKKQGADFGVIITTAMNRVAEKVEEFSGLPILPFAEPTINAIMPRLTRKMTKALVLGTPQLYDDFYMERKFKQGGINVVIPNIENRGIFEDIRIKCGQGRMNYDTEFAFVKTVAEYRKDGVKDTIVCCSKYNIMFSNRYFNHGEFGGMTYFSMANLHIESMLNRCYREKEA